MPVLNLILVLVCFLCTVLSVVGLIQIVRCREPAAAYGLPPARVGRRAPVPPRGRIRWSQVVAGLIAIAAAVPLAMFAGFLAFWLSESYLMLTAVFVSGVIAIIGTCSAMARDAGGVS
jgi:hypothetical protein